MPYNDVIVRPGGHAFYWVIVLWVASVMFVGWFSAYLGVQRERSAAQQRARRAEATGAATGAAAFDPIVINLLQSRCLKIEKATYEAGDGWGVYRNVCTKQMDICNITMVGKTAAGIIVGTSTMKYLGDVPAGQAGEFQLTMRDDVRISIVEFRAEHYENRY